MSKFIDLTNQRFGFWLVIKKSLKSKAGQTQWFCQCECGTIKEITTNSLRSYNSTSCGCNHSINLINQTFNYLKVIKTDYSKGRKYWLCQCICGKQIICSAHQLIEKKISSCGCKDQDMLFILQNINGLLIKVNQLFDKIKT